MLIHPTAIVDKNAVIDPSTEIGPFAIIEGDVQIGKNNKIMARAFVGSGTAIGDDNEIHIGAVIGHSPQDKRYKGEKTRLVVGSRNIFREYVTIHRSTHEDSPTVIGNDCMIMGGCHIAHDCKVNNFVIMANMAAMAGHVHVADRAFIGGGAMIHQFVHIGRVAILAGNSRFSMDIPPFVIAAEKNQVWGINIIGLRRAGFPQETINEIKTLYRLFFRDHSPRPVLLERIAQHNFQSGEVKEFLDFVQSSKRGICPAANTSAEKNIELAEKGIEMA